MATSPAEFQSQLDMYRIFIPFYMFIAVLAARSAASAARKIADVK